MANEVTISGLGVVAAHFAKFCEQTVTIRTVGFTTSFADLIRDELVTSVATIKDGRVGGRPGHRTAGLWADRATTLTRLVEASNYSYH